MTAFAAALTVVGLVPVVLVTVEEHRDRRRYIADLEHALSHNPTVVQARRARPELLQARRYARRRAELKAREAEWHAERAVEVGREVCDWLRRSDLVDARIELEAQQ